jgi:heme/copper-type cytochrome/quinol oxidase subunit 4
MMYYGGFGGGMWVGFLIVAVLLVVPFWRILPRNVIPNWVALVAIIPLGALVLLWVVAFKDMIEKR